MKAVVHDLGGPVVAGHQGDEEPARLVGLVDRERVVGDQLGERVGDPVEQCVERLLGENVVKDVRESTVGVDERLDTLESRSWRALARRRFLGLSRNRHGETAAAVKEACPQFKPVEGDRPSLERGNVTRSG
jgi:hypothetical protein